MMLCSTLLLMVALVTTAVANHPPVFKTGTFISTDEDTAKGTILGRVSAVDTDGPETVELKIGDNVTAQLVKLGPTTVSQNKHAVSADIILITELDSDFDELYTHCKPHFDCLSHGQGGFRVLITAEARPKEVIRGVDVVVRVMVEHSPYRKMMFVAFDGERTSTITITLSIQDVNDNAPKFTQDSYAATLSATAPIGFVVLITTAVDPDPTYGGVVHYKLQTNDLFAYQAFEVNVFTGMVMVKAPLVIKKGHDMYIKVVATDGGGLSSSANVTLTIV